MPCPTAFYGGHTLMLHFTTILSLGNLSHYQTLPSTSFQANFLSIEYLYVAETALGIEYLLL